MLLSFECVARWAENKGLENGLRQMLSRKELIFPQLETRLGTKI